MSLLHYTIGLPPRRHGGSVQYAADLISQQSKTQNVHALVCGDTFFRRAITSIRDSNSYFTNKVPVHILTSPSTPSLLYGIRNPQTICNEKAIDVKSIKDFILKNSIEIFHIHTFMGLPIEVVKTIKDMGVKIVYTTHDFYGICPHTNLIDYEGNPCNSCSPNRCALCNQDAPSDLFMRISNSTLYYNIKKFIPNKSKIVGKATQSNTWPRPNNKLVSKFKALQSYYHKYFDLIDLFIFNSSQTEAIFKKNLNIKKSITLPVITNGIKDKRAKLSPSTPLKFGYIGNIADFKGFPMLKSVVKELYDEGINNFQLLAYTNKEPGRDADCPLIKYQPPYKYSEISDIMYNLDCMVVPSKWYETFSLVTLESIAHGRPAIVSNHVGAKDIVAQYNSNFVFSNSNDLNNIIRDIINNPSLLVDTNTIILSKDWKYDIASHAQDILSAYKSI